MNLNLSVQHPILVLGELLKVEYSTDGVNFTLDSYQSSNTFTTAYGGFTAGVTYYFRFTIVKPSPLVECDSIIVPYTVPDEVDCLDFEASITTIDNVFRLEISYTIPSPYVQPCGGYVLKYGISYPLTTINYATLPSSISIIVNNAPYYVEIYQVDCDGNLILCYEEQVEPEIPPCSPAVVNSVTFTNIGGQYTLTFNVTQSTPTTNTFIINYNQCNFIAGGGSGIPDSGSVTRNSTNNNPEIITVPVNPNFNTGPGTLTYCGTIIDVCNFSRPFDVSLSD